MTGSRVRIENFGGMIPRQSDRLLPPTHAKTARNVKLQSGEIRGIRQLREVYDFQDPSVVKGFRLPNPNVAGGYTYVGFDSIDTDFYKGPLLNDIHNRYYRFGGGDRPLYNTLDRIENGDPWFWLGVPPPVNDLTVTPTGGTGDDEDRFYVYTFVSPYGEEGPPCGPVQATGPVDASWDLANMDTVVPDQANRPVGFTKRIYRTVPGFSAVEFFLVAEVDIGDATYSDTISSDIVARNSLLESTNWQPPPDNLEGAVVMPNGFFVAWDARNVHFSETYRPHAWPAPYDLSTEYDIVGAGVFGQSVVLATAGAPYVGTGVTPEALTLTKDSSVEPCLSRHSVVSYPYGVVYASQNGLVLVGFSGVQLATKQLLTKNEWMNRYDPANLKAAQFETAYIGFYSRDDGLLLDATEPMSTFTELDRFESIDYVQTDPWTGDVFVMRGGVAFLWDSIDQHRERYIWSSKIFSFPKPCNIGAVYLDVESLLELEDDLVKLVLAATEWNRARMDAGALDVIGGNAIGMPFAVDFIPPTNYREQDKQPLAGSPLIDIAKLIREVSLVRLRVFADEKLVYDSYYRDENLLYDSYYSGQQCIRLPSGFKARDWRFEVEGRRFVYSIHAAETCKALQDV